MGVLFLQPGKPGNTLGRLEKTAANTGVGSGNGYFGLSPSPASETETDRARCPKRGCRSA